MVSGRPVIGRDTDVVSGGVKLVGGGEEIDGAAMDTYDY